MMNIKINKFFTILIISLFIGLNLNAQNGDCITALYFQDSLGVIPTPESYGKQMEIKGNNIKSEYFFTQEHNTSWSVIHFTMDASFQFELVPQFADDDFDFILFNYFGTSTCDSILNKTILPLRSNLSKRTPEKGSDTRVHVSISDCSKLLALYQIWRRIMLPLLGVSLPWNKSWPWPSP